MVRAFAPSRPYHDLNRIAVRGAGILSRVQDLPPSVKLPGHDPDAGLLLEWRLSPHGDWWAKVYWTAIIGGYKGGLDPRETWFHEGAVRKIKGEDYSRVQRTRAEPDRP